MTANATAKTVSAPATTALCSAEERTVLNMIKVWPDVPAIVTYSANDGWTVSTDPAAVERHVKVTAATRP